MNRASSVLAALCLVGCAGGGHVSADAACTDLAAAQCARLDACSANLDTARVYGDAETCKARVKLGCLAAAAAPNTAPNTQDVSEFCGQQFPSFSCADVLNNAAQPACTPPPGKLDINGVCLYGRQCASGHCAVPRGLACGNCAPPSMAGDSCAVVPCGAGLFCSKKAQVCAMGGALMGTCDPDNPCGAGLSCQGAMPGMNPGDPFMPGMCVAAGQQAGVPCDPSQAMGPGCDPNAGLYCEASIKRCAKLRASGAGQTCGAGYYCTGGAQCVGKPVPVPGCSADTDCNAPAKCQSSSSKCIETCTKASDCKSGLNPKCETGVCAFTNFTCVAPAADGNPCDTAAGPGCLAPARCILGNPSGTAGTCTLPDATQCM